MLVFVECLLPWAIQSGPVASGCNLATHTNEHLHKSNYHSKVATHKQTHIQISVPRAELSLVERSNGFAFGLRALSGGLTRAQKRTARQTLCPIMLALVHKSDWKVYHFPKCLCGACYSSGSAIVSGLPPAIRWASPLSIRWAPIKLL